MHFFPDPKVYVPAVPSLLEDRNMEHQEKQGTLIPIYNAQDR